jgi:hypothetical protein
MKVLFCTQGGSLQLFDALRRALKEQRPITQAGFTVADSLAYACWLSANPDFENDGHILLKEWDITGTPNSKPDLAKLAKYEQELGGEAGLFGAIVADRRLFMGPDCTYTQDYRRRFSDDELLCILQRGLVEVEKMFDTLTPDVVISFICVTMLDYLTYLFAKARGIRFLNLRPTRIGDRVSFSCMLNDPSPELVFSYKQLMDGGGQSAYADEAQRYIKRVREEHGRYEGVVRPSDRPALHANTARLSRLAGLVSAGKNYLAYRRSTAVTDNHVPEPLKNLLFTAIHNPIQAKRVRRHLASSYVAENVLPNIRYVFFPLHTEPEVSLLVYGRPYVNQIEIIRMLAMSLPADMVLVVKEHPWMVGKRSLAAYDKMLNIPRVKFVDPRLDARILIQQADLVAVVTGSVALEAAMLGKPVITFGDCPYNLLPFTMVRRCDDPRRLQSIIRETLLNYANDERALIAYVSAVFETSVSVNLYSVLLRKERVYAERSGEYGEEIKKLADEVFRRIEDSPRVAVYGAAAW